MSEDEDSLAPLGIGSGLSSRRSRSTNSSQRVLAIGEETGQKERMIPYGETTSPGFSSQSQSDDSEREDGALTNQIALLTVKNNNLQKQLKERELERDRLREQLELQRQDRNLRTPYSPTGLPSRLLDGRKVLRDSIPGLASGVGPSLSPSPHSPSSHSPRFSTPPGSAGGNAMDPGHKGFLDSFAAELLASAERVQLENLKRKNLELERHLHEVSEEKRHIEHELQRQREAFAKIQVREQDLSKDIEILRDENSHHSGAINRLKSERDGLQTENDSLHEELHTASEKLNKTEKCYKEVEHENMSLEAEIEQLIMDKKQLYEEKQNLQAAVEDALKTKENYRSTIKQLREQNRSLERQVGDSPAVRERKVGGAKPEKDKLRRPPETKGQQTLGEVMNLREEKTELQGKILSAQQEIDSLKADLQAQEIQEHSLEEFCEEVTAHLLEFQDRVIMMNEDLSTTKTTIATLLNQQQSLVHDSFMLLVEKCREQLSAAQKDKSKGEEALKVSQKSLKAMEGDYENLKMENAKLQDKRSSISSDVSKLRSEIASLQDQKRLLSVQLSQNEALAQEKDKRVTELEVEQKQLQEKFTTSEKRWKHEYVRLERDWEGKLAEAHLAEEMLSEERDSLLKQQAALEQSLEEVQFENQQLMIAKTELEAQVGNWEEKLERLTSQVDENDLQLSSAQREVANLLAERACISAKMMLTQQNYEERIEALKAEHSGSFEEVNSKNKQLQDAIASMKAERENLSDQLALVTEKETQIDRLTSQMAVLSQEREQLKVEKELLNEKYAIAQQEFQSLAEAEQTRLLNNEKVKLQLKTEIELLKSKLKSVGDEKHKLEDQILKLAAEKVQTSSAFHAVPQNKQIEQLMNKISALQAESKQHKRVNQEQSSSRVQLVDLQSRLASLELENKRLREAARNSTDAIDATATLRKQVSELSRKSFFLESEKKTLSDKVHMMSTSLKVAREMKDRMATERIMKLQEQNQSLQERIRSLEGTLTTKLMAADQKIVSTVKENDKLKQRLLHVQEAMATHQQEDSTLATLIESLSSESDLITQMRANLESSRVEFEQLEAKQERVQALQTEIQQLLSSGSRSATPTLRTNAAGTHSLPPVLKSLPPGFLSSFQGRSTSPSDSARPISPSASIVQEKLTQMQAVSCEFGDGLERHQKVLKEQESELSQLRERFSAIEASLLEASNKNKEAVPDLQASTDGIELKPDQIQTIALLQKQNEMLQDQVIDRDFALQDIELQMKKDYEMNDKKFALHKSQVLQLREQLSEKDNLLRTKDLYIHQSEERCLDIEKQLFKSHKEMERALKERDQLVTKGIPENLQLQGITTVTDALRVQGIVFYLQHFVFVGTYVC